MAVPTFVNEVGDYGASSTGSLSLVLLTPAGIQNGDLILAFVCALQMNDENYPNITPPTGFTMWDGASRLIDTGGPAQRARIYYRTANNEPASYIWDFDGVAGKTIRAAVSMVFYRGVIGKGSLLWDQYAQKNAGDSWLLSIANASGDNRRRVVFIAHNYFGGAGNLLTEVDTGTWVAMNERADRGLVYVSDHAHQSYINSNHRATTSVNMKPMSWTFVIWGTQDGEANLVGVGKVGATGTPIKRAEASLQGVGKVTPQGTLMRYGRSDLVGVGVASAEPRLTRGGQSSLVGVGSLSAQAVTNMLGAANLVGVGRLEAQGSRGLKGQADLQGVGILTLEDNLYRYGESNLVGVGVLSSQGSAIRGGVANLQGVGVLSPQTTLYHHGASQLSGVGVLSGEGAASRTAQAALKGVARLSAEAIGGLAPDFTVYDAYITLPDNLGTIGVLYWPGRQPNTSSRRMTPLRTDVGINPDEVRPDWGYMFSQSDFSGGEGQRFYHRQSADHRKYMYSEGFDISEPGRLRHLHDVGTALSDTAVADLIQADGALYLASGTVVKRATSLPGSWTSEDPHAGETATDVLSLTAGGTKVFAALGANGVHVRDNGTWSHYKPDGTNNLDISPATVVRWAKDRLFVVGGTGSRSIYEVTSNSSPTPIETLPVGWKFVDVVEAGGYVHACAVSNDGQSSAIHHYGLNSSASAIEKKGVTRMPQGDVIYTGAGYLNQAVFGGGRRNKSGGYDPILYQVLEFDDSTGEMTYFLVGHEEGAGSADYSVRACMIYGRGVLCGWTLGSQALGGARTGLAIYHLDKAAFARHLKAPSSANGKRVLAITSFEGSIVFIVSNAGVMYELGSYVQNAELVTSYADFASGAVKVWDTFECLFEPLQTNTSVELQYTVHAVEEGDWRTAFMVNNVGAERGVVRISEMQGSRVALKVVSTATQSASPVIRSVTARGTPVPLEKEWQITRYIRIIETDRKDPWAPAVWCNPDLVFSYLRRSLNRWITLYEPEATWRGFVEEVEQVEPEQPYISATGGESRKNVYIVRLMMVGFEA